MHKDRGQIRAEAKRKKAVFSSLQSWTLSELAAELSHNLNQCFKSCLFQKMKKLKQRHREEKYNGKINGNLSCYSLQKCSCSFAVIYTYLADAYSRFAWALCPNLFPNSL